MIQQPGSNGYDYLAEISSNLPDPSYFLVGQPALKRTDNLFEIDMVMDNYLPKDTNTMAVLVPFTEKVQLGELLGGEYSIKINFLHVDNSFMRSLEDKFIVYGLITPQPIIDKTAPVPLPPATILLLSGVGLLSLAKRKKSKR